MRLSWLSSLGISLALLVSISAFAQHSSGGSSAGGSSSSGGSHGGGGGSSSSGGSHGSSGGSSSGHSSAHGSPGSSSTSSHSHAAGSNSFRSMERHSHTNNLRSIQAGNHSPAARPAQAEKRGFFSFFRRAFRKPEPKPVSDLRHRVRICLKGPCETCPTGEAAGRGGCVTRYQPRRQDLCSLWGLTSTPACEIQSGYPDECVAERMAMEQEAKRARAAEQDRLNACSAGQTAECSDLTTSAQSENAYYRMLQDRYEQCRQRNGGRFPLGNITFGGHASGQALDRLDFGFEYR